MNGAGMGRVRRLWGVGVLGVLLGLGGPAAEAEATQAQGAEAQGHGLAPLPTPLPAPLPEGWAALSDVEVLRPGLLERAGDTTPLQVSSVLSLELSQSTSRTLEHQSDSRNEHWRASFGRRCSKRSENVATLR